MYNTRGFITGQPLCILGDPGAVSGAREKSKRARKKFGRRRLFPSPTNCPWDSEDGHYAYWPAVSMMLPALFEHQVENFSYKQFCPPVRNSCSPAEGANETLAIMYRMKWWLTLLINKIAMYNVECDTISCLLDRKEHVLLKKKKHAIFFL